MTTTKFFIALALFYIVTLKIGLDHADNKVIVHDTIVDTFMVTDYMCFIGGDFERCDPDKLAREVLAFEL